MGVESSVLQLREGKRGDLNLITDVSGVQVEHVTLNGGCARTGVTVVLPHAGNCFTDKVMAASYVANGFGKTIGLVQLDELGTIETPIVLTNTLSVGTAATALVRHMLAQNDDIGRTTGTVNPLICECNDGRLNDIRALLVNEEDVEKALIGAESRTANAGFAEGAVGAGAGMVCMGLKGGIGSSSRVFELDDTEYVIGCLVLANFGRAGDLVIDGERVGERIVTQIAAEERASLAQSDKGSCIMILATDAPASQLQLKRIAKRAELGLARVGSRMGTGSGDIAIAFSTTNRVPHYPQHEVLISKAISDDAIDKVFRATVDVVEESVISALWHAEPVVGYSGLRVRALCEFL